MFQDGVVLPLGYLCFFFFFFPVFRRLVSTLGFLVFDSVFILTCFFSVSFSLSRGVQKLFPFALLPFVAMCCHAGVRDFCL